MPKAISRIPSGRAKRTPLIKKVVPNSDAQQDFVYTSVDIAIYGGAAGGGKTYGLLMHPMKYIENGEFRAVVFRRTLDEITKSGGLWDEASKMYPGFGGYPNKKDLHWTFPSGARVTFDHLQYDDTLERYKSAQYDGIYYDQVEMFTEKMFWYMMSRSRSTSGIEPYIRATANPDPDCFLHNDGTGIGTGLISWWICPRTGYAIPERDRAIRWFMRYEEKLYWGDSPQAIYDQFPNVPRQELIPQSIQFIKSTVYDNVDLMNKNPRYIGRLKSLQRIDRYRLLGHKRRGGNWNIRATAGTYFQKNWFLEKNLMSTEPINLVQVVRHWDLAATKKTKKNDPDWTCGTLLGIDMHNKIYILDQKRIQDKPLAVEDLIQDTAREDGWEVPISIEQEGGASGIGWPDSIIRNRLQGYIAEYHKPPGDKESRAKPLSSQAEIRNVFIYNRNGPALIAPWITEFLNEAENFPDGAHDDRVDSCCGAYERLTVAPVGVHQWMDRSAKRRDAEDVFGMGMNDRPQGREDGFRRPYDEQGMPDDTFLS